MMKEMILTMSNRRVIAIGDVHGCFYTLKELWERVNPTQEDIIIFLGDYIDRGNHSYEVIEFLKEKKKEFPFLILLLGNHEDLCYNAYETKDSWLWLMNGGGATQNSFLQNGKEWDSDLLLFISDLESYIVLEDYGLCFVHANIPEAEDPEYETLKNMLWSRSFVNNTPFTVVCGHTRHKHPKEYNNPNKIICIDTGCVGGGHLTAAIFEKGREEPFYCAVKMNEKDWGENI